MSRRGLCLLLAMGMLLGMLSGCGAKASSDPGIEETSFGSVSASESQISAVEGQAETSPGTGSFSMPYNSSYGWDPYACRSMENRAVMQLIYEGLFTITPAFDAEPLLCSGYEVSEDGLTYTLNLRSAAFSNGKELKAEDVVYSMGRAEESELYSSRFQDISSYYASGTGTVVIELKDANDRLPCLLTFPIVPSGSGKETAPGTGPFVRSSDTVLTQNGQWWQGTAGLNFQTVTLFASASAEETRDNFEIDNVHFVYNDPSASTAAAFHCDYELWNSRSTVMQYIGFNFTSSLFQEEAVRQAVAHVIDRTGIAETVYHNFADAASLPVHPASSMYDEELAQEFNYTSVQSAMEELLKTDAFDLPKEKIAALQNPGAAVLSGTEDDAAENSALEETADQSVVELSDDETEGNPEDAESTEGETENSEGETGYNRIVMIVRSGNLSRVSAAEQAAENLEAVGFTVELRELENDAFYRALSNYDFDLYYGEVFLKPDFDLRELLLPEGDYCYGGLWEDSELRNLISNAMENSGNRYDLYEYIMESGFLCPVLFVNNAVFTTRGVFSGLNPAPDNLFYQVSNIRVNQN